MKKYLYDFIFITFLLALGLLFRFYILSFLPFSQNLNLIYGLGNGILIWLIGQRFFDKKIAYFSLFLYIVSPWSMYTELAGSVYIFWLFILLIFSYAAILISKYKFINGKVFFFIGLFLLIYLLFNQRNKITVFDNVGLINAVNEFRGETSDTIFKSIDKFIQNKYIYLTSHLIYNFLLHLTPLTYFTQEFKLLNFSFSPPIFVGLLIPFILGFKLWLDLWQKLNLKLLLVFILILPSVLSKDSPDLSKLIIFSPLIFYTISFGLIRVLLISKSRLLRALLLVTVLLVITQLVITLVDIQTREPSRFQKSEVRI